jgi:hypothetical protein
LLHLITLNDTHALGVTPPDKGSACRRALYLTTHNIQTRQTSTTQAGFRPAVPASEGPQTYSLDRAAAEQERVISILTHDLKCGVPYVIT